MNKYTVAINSDRVHISLDGVPVETKLFSTYADEHQDGEEIAIGLVVIKAMQINDGGDVTVYNKGFISEKKSK